MEIIRNSKAAIQLEKETDLKIVDIGIPYPNSQELIVKLVSTGICHSQLNQMNHPILERPMLLGHEGFGQVTEIGPNVKNIKEGDHVIITWIPCAPDLIEKNKATIKIKFGGKEINVETFTWSQYIVTDINHIIKIPSHKAYISKNNCIIGCPIPAGAGAVLNTAKVKEGESVAVFGMGGVGLSAICMASVLQANPIIAVDLEDEKLDFAKKFGASHTINPKNHDPVDKIKALTNGGVEYAFHATASKTTAEQILQCTRGGGPGINNIGGMALLVGTAGMEVNLDSRLILGGQRQYVGSLAAVDPERDFIKFLDLQKNGKLKIDKLVTNEYKLEILMKHVTI